MENVGKIILNIAKGIGSGRQSERLSVEKDFAYGGLKAVVKKSGAVMNFGINLCRKRRI